ncbi:type IV secretion protein Rhs, partial [Pseudomonas sp. SDT2931_S440]
VPNPTGWVDPLGLNTCPGGDGCKPSAGVEKPTAKVDDSEPPLPKQTQAERRTKIDELTEANAKRRVLEFEKKYDMHTVVKHGPEIPGRAMKQRAIDGTNPTNGKKGKISSSSQFKSWKVQLHAINKALYKMRGKNPSSTGFDNEGNPVVVMELPEAGHGYRPNSKDKQNPKYSENMNKAEVRFDKNNVSRPFTAFPVR